MGQFELKDPTGRSLGVLTFPDDATPEQISGKAREAIAALGEPGVPRTQTQLGPEGGIQRAPGVTMQPGAQAASRVGQAVGEFAKQEALPIAATTAVGAVLPPAGPAAGLAARAAMGGARLAATGGVGVAGMRATRAIRGQEQPPLGGIEDIGEFVFSATPFKAAETALGPRTAQQLVEGVAGSFGKAGRRDVGVRLQRNLFKIRQSSTAKLDKLFEAARSTGDQLGLAAPVSRDVANSLTAALQSAGPREAAMLQTAMQPVLDAIGRGDNVTFRQLSEAIRDLAPLQSRFNIGARELDPSAIEELSSALRLDMTKLAQGTRAEKATQAANDFYVGEHLPTLTAIRSLEAGRALPRQTIRLLARDPDKLELVFKNIPETEQNEIRAAFFTDLLAQSKDLSRVENIQKLSERWQRLDPSSRKFLSGAREPEIARIFERMEKIVRQEKTVQQFRLAQSATLVVSGAALGAALTQGDLSSALPVLLGTGLGVHVMARVMANPAARRQFRRGLDKGGRVGGQVVLQAIERAGVAGVAPESRLPSLGQPQAASPAGPLRGAPPVQAGP